MAGSLGLLASIVEAGEEIDEGRLCGWMAAKGSATG